MVIYKNRGMFLETIINKTILKYKIDDIGIFHKKELNINFHQINNNNGKLEIKNGFIKEKSTTDYYGLYNGVFVTFEAKSTHQDFLPFSNIKEHQKQYLIDVKKHGGCSFIIIFFAIFDEFFILSINVLLQLINLNKKSISIQDARKFAIKIEITFPGYLDFIPLIESLI